MGKQTLKKYAWINKYLRFWCGPVKNINHTFTIFDVQTKVTFMKNISNFCDNWSILTWFTVQTSITTDSQTNFKLSDGNTFNNGTTGEGRSF